MKKAVTFYIIAGIFTITSYILTEQAGAQVSKKGTAGAQFLKIPVDPRGLAMGGAFTAVTNDVSSLYWNPAGIVVSGKPEFILSDVKWVLDIRNDFVGGILPIRKYDAIGFNITALTMGDEEITSIEQPEGTGYKWNANSIALSLSYARWFTDEFAFGVSAKMLREAIYVLSATGFAMDAGALLYPHAFKNLKFGISVTNFGADMQFKGAKEVVYREDWPSVTGGMNAELISKSYPIPLCIKLGIAYDFLKTNTNNLTCAIDLSHPNDGPEKWHTGLEYGFNDFFFLRGGFIYEPYDSSLTQEANTLTFGTGLKYPLKGYYWAINYASEIDYEGTEINNFGGIKHRLSIKWGR